MAHFFKRTRGLGILVGIGSFIVFLLFQAQGIVGGDSGDLVTAAATFGVPHPPGYPLYTFIGWLLTHLPLSTISWRVGLLSSIPHAVVVALVFAMTAALTRRRWIGLFSAILLTGNYVFFLYSVTPEVFALFDLFVIVLVLLLFMWQREKNERWFLAAVFVFGLSLTHHQVILWLVPAFAYWIWRYRSLFPETRAFRVRAIVLFAAGLSPYLYTIIAAHGNSVINWDRAVDLNGFIRLVTRADYGTFVSSGLFGSQLVERWLQVQAYAQFVLLDFLWIGVGLILLGFLYFWKNDKRLCTFLILALFFVGPLFFFYASFPLVNRFTLGTYERFLLPSYVLMALIAGAGLRELEDDIRLGLGKTRASRLTPLILVGGFIIIFLYPLMQLGVTLWRFNGLRFDQTGDNVGRDVLAPLPRDSILLLGRDTVLFSTQYVRYALRYRSDVVTIHASRLGSPDYQTTLSREFPSLTFPATADATVNLVTSQYPKTRIFSTAPLAVGTGWYWVPYGLTYELVPDVNPPTAQHTYEENMAVWNTLHDPLAGILARYNHLMLSDTRDVYASSHIGFGTVLLRAEMLPEAEQQFRIAADLGGDGETANAYTYLGLTQLFEKQCDNALASFAAAKHASIVPATYLTFYEGVTYRDCSGDADRAKILLDRFELLQKASETPLNK